MNMTDQENDIELMKDQIKTLQQMTTEQYQLIEKLTKCVIELNNERDSKVRLETSNILKSILDLINE